MKTNGRLMKYLCCLLAVSAMSGAVGCSDGGAAGTAETTASPESQSAATDTAAETTTEPAYKYPDKKYGGYKFRVLNTLNYYGAKSEFDFKALSGEVLNDAIYTRNRNIEERFDIKFATEDYDFNSMDFDKTVTMVQNAVLAGDDNWDVAYLSGYKLTPLLTSRSLLDLKKIDGLRLDEPWWDGEIIEKASIGGKLFFVTGSAHLMVYDMTECIFFNEVMMKNLGLEPPYKTVKDGKWTIDKLYEYSVKAASLNGADSWAWNKDKSTVYGLSAHTSNSANKLLVSMGVCYVDVSGGSARFLAKSEHALNAIAKLAKLYNTASGVTLRADWDDLNADKGGYVYVFREERAMFMTAGLKSASSLRDMKSDFGILPQPKYDETQEKYNSFTGVSSLALTIPITNKDVDRTAVVMDALYYDSHENVIPVYFDTMLSQKLLRNNESIEMLELITDGRTTDLALLYSWISGFVTSLNNKVFAGDSDLASVVESGRSGIEATVNKFLADVTK